MNEKITPRNLANTTRQNILANVLMGATSLMLNALLARRLNVEEYGVAQYMGWLAQTMWAVIGMGLPTTITRYIAFFLGKGQSFLAHELQRKSLFVLFLLMVLGIIILTFVQTDLPKVSVWMYFIGISLQGFTATVLAGRGDYQSILRGSMGYTAAIAIVLVLIGNAKVAPQHYLFIQGIGCLTYVLCAGLRLVWVYDHTSMHGSSGDQTLDVREIVRYALGSWVALILSLFMWQRMELFFIRRTLTLSDVAVYAASLSLSMLFTQPFNLLGSTLMPYFSENIGRGDRSQVALVYRLTTKILAAGVLFFSLFAAFSSDEIMTLVYGTQYSNTGLGSALLFAGSSIAVISSPGSSLLYGEGQPWFIVVSAAVGAVVMVLVGLYLYPIFGVVGAAWSRIGIQAALVCAGTIYIKFRLKYPFPAYGIFALTVVAAIAVSLANKIIPASGIEMLVLRCVVACALYVPLVVLTRVFNTQEREKMSYLMQRIWKSC